MGWGDIKKNAVVVLFQEGFLLESVLSEMFQEEVSMSVKT